MTPGAPFTVYDCESCGAGLYRDLALTWRHINRSSPCLNARPVPVPFTAPVRKQA